MDDSGGSTSGSERSGKMLGIGRLTPEQLAQALHVTIVDVRDEDERYSGLGYIPGSISVPDDMCSADEEKERLALPRALALVCLSGKRSLACAEKLVARGVTDVWHLEGGILAWQAQGYALCGVRDVPSDELIELSSPAEFPRAVLSCFVAESVEAQLDAGAGEINDPTDVVEQMFQMAGDRMDASGLIASLDRLAVHARRAGHPNERIAANVDRMRASLLRMVELEQLRTHVR